MEEFTPAQRLLMKIRDERCKGNAAELARRIKKDPTYVNRLFYPAGKKGAKGVGLEIMRACTVAFDLPPGYWEGADAVPTPQLFDEHSEGGYAVEMLSAAGSMGAGEEQHDDVVVGKLTLSPSWISKSLKPITAPENLRFIHGYGDSMSPTFEDGSILLVDKGVASPDVDGIYVLEANSRIYIKRVRQRMDGSYEVSSDNPTVKTVDVLSGKNRVNVLGRVVWLWNGKKV